MTSKSITGECVDCESMFNVMYESEIVSKELPTYCPFCGSIIEEDALTEEYIDDEEPLDDEEWEA